MPEFPEPFIQSFDTPGPQVVINPDGTPKTFPVTANDPQPANRESTPFIIAAPQVGPGRLVHPDGTPVDLDATVLMPYNQTTSPGVIVVG